MDFVGRIKAILDTFFLTEMYTGTRDKLSPLQTSIQILLYVCAILAIVTVWEIQNPLMMSNTRWHLKHAIKTQIPPAYLKITFDKWGIQGRTVTCCWRVLVSRRMCFATKASWQSRVSKVVCFHYSLPLPKSHIWYSWKLHLTHPLTLSWQLFFIMLAPPKGRMLFLLLCLTDTVVMSNDSCQGSEGASKWTDTGSVNRTSCQIHWQHYYTKDFI